MKDALNIKIVVVFVVALLVGLVSNGLAATIFEQNYDSETLGSSAGWVTFLTPEYIPSVVNNDSISGQSLKLHNNGLDRATGVRSFTPTTESPTDVIISFDAKWAWTEVENPDRCWGFCFSAGGNPIGTWLDSSIVKMGGGNWVWNGGPGMGFYVWDSAAGTAGEYRSIIDWYPGNPIPFVEGQPDNPWYSVANRWFHIKIWAHYDTQKCDVTVTRLDDGQTGTLTGISFPGGTGITPQQLNTVKFDDVQVREGRVEDVYVDNMKVAPPSGLATLTGKVTLSDFGGDKASVGVQVDFIQGGVVVHTYNTLLDSAGRYTIEGIAPGIYGVAIKGASWLRRTVPGQVLVADDTTSCDVTLTSGDLDGDNHVTTTDLSDFLLNLNQNGE